MAQVMPALIDQESSWNPNAVSPLGHTGLGQLSKHIAKAFGVADRKDPIQNIKGATAYLSDNMKRYRRMDLAIADYHCGARAVIAAKGKVPNCHDKAAGITTPQYVSSVMRKAGLKP